MGLIFLFEFVFCASSERKKTYSMMMMMFHKVIFLCLLFPFHSLPLNDEYLWILSINDIKSLSLSLISDILRMRSLFLFKLNMLTLYDKNLFEKTDWIFIYANDPHSFYIFHRTVIVSRPLFIAIISVVETFG